MALIDRGCCSGCRIGLCIGSPAGFAGGDRDLAGTAGNGAGEAIDLGDHHPQVVLHLGNRTHQAAADETSGIDACSQITGRDPSGDGCGGRGLPAKLTQHAAADDQRHGNQDADGQRNDTR